MSNPHMTMKFGLLVFDLDGTLVDSRDDIAAAVSLAMDELGVPAPTPETVCGYIGGGVHNLLSRSLTDRYAHLLNRAVETFWACYREHIADTTRTYPGVEEMLDGFSGRRMALVTNKPLEHTRLLLERLGLSRHFVSVQGWRPGLPLKPDPGLLRMAVDEAGVREDGVVMIGDGVADMLAAKAAGVSSCAVGYGYGDGETLRAAGAEYFAGTVREISGLFG